MLVRLLEARCVFGTVMNCWQVTREKALILHLIIGIQTRCVALCVVGFVIQEHTLAVNVDTSQDEQHTFEGTN